MFATGTTCLVLGALFVILSTKNNSEKDGCENTRYGSGKCRWRLGNVRHFLKATSSKVFTTTESGPVEIQKDERGWSDVESTDTFDLKSLNPIYREIHTHLRMTTLPEMPVDEFDLASYTPFCSKNGTLTPVSAPQLPIGVSTSCVPWEELELDMLLMYIDLVSIGMMRSLAEEFYRQVRCLSRANVRINPDTKEWQVCFSFDFSKHVGTLLANYIQQDMKLNPPVKTVTPTPVVISRAVNKLSSGSSLTNESVRQTNSVMNLLLLFQFAGSFRLYRDSNTVEARFDELERTSCCKYCANPDYFVNLEYMSCISDPFGKHCCHTACKSLRHLRVGVATSIYYCCLNSNPQRCVQGSTN